MDNPISPKNLLRMETCLLLYAENIWAKEFSKIKITSTSSRSREDRASDRNRSVRFCRKLDNRSTSTVTTTRNLKSWVRRSNEEVNSMHDNLFSNLLSTRIPELCFRCIRRALADREHRRKVNIHQQGMKLRQPQVISIGFSQRNWKIIPAIAKTQK